jgi:glycosyltransferase involved in cell wall biosynthesis
LKVLFCTLAYYPSEAGGAEHQGRLQAEALVRRGHEVTVVCARRDQAKSGAINGVSVVRLANIRRQPFRQISYLASLALYLLIRLNNFDLVHVHLANLQADVAVAFARLYRKPSYLKLAAGGRRGEIGRMSKIAFITRLFGIRHATRVQAISDEIEADLEQIGVHGERVRRIPNGLDICQFRPPSSSEKAECRRALGLPEDAVIVLYMGRFARYKGVLDLLTAWQSLQPSSATLLLVGTANTENSISEMPDLEGLVVHPWTRDTLLYYHAADIFVLPSHVEGMSNALLEASAGGLAVVATRVGAAEEVVTHGETGLLVEPGDVAGLRGALTSLLGDPCLRARLGAAAAERVRREYAIEVVVDRIEQEYRSLV